MKFFTARLLAAAAIITLAHPLSCSMIDYIPDRDLTVMRIIVIRQSLEKYAQTTGSFSVPLNALPPIEGKDAGLTDAWGSPFIFNVESDRVEIRSLGPDKKASADDIVGIFETRVPRVGPIDDSWIVRPSLQ